MSDFKRAYYLRLAEDCFDKLIKLRQQMELIANLDTYVWSPAPITYSPGHLCIFQPSYKGEDNE